MTKANGRFAQFCKQAQKLSQTICFIKKMWKPQKVGKINMTDSLVLIGLIKPSDNISCHMTNSHVV
jgi:predicted RNA-binding protein